MACEFICSFCKGDGTRCRCVQERGGGSYHISEEEKIADAERKAREAMRELREFRINHSAK